MTELKVGQAVRITVGPLTGKEAYITELMRDDLVGLTQSFDILPVITLPRSYVEPVYIKAAAKE